MVTFYNTISGWRRAWMLAAALAGLAGCGSNPNTTGDPTQGGLFGWSPEKAQQRQRELQATADATRAQAQAERDRVAALRANERQAAGTVNRLTQHLKSLEAENDRLESELVALIDARKLRGSDADRLREMLRRSQAVRADLARQAERRTAATPPTEPELTALDTQNRLLHREVMLLLGR